MGFDMFIDDFNAVTKLVTKAGGETKLGNVARDKLD